MGTKIKVVVSKGIEQAIVPKVTGMTEEEAIKALENAKLKYEKVEEESKKVEAGYVISQETDPDSQVFAGDTVIIHISTGTKKIQIPSVIGKSEEDAKKAITSLGLKVNIVNEEDQSKDNGTVLKQSIDAGKEVEEGTTVTITINKLTETKYATLQVNVKSLNGGKVEYENTAASSNTENETNSTSTLAETKVKKIQLRIEVNGETVLNELVDPTTTNLLQTISGKGTVTVKFFIDDVVISRATKDINLNESSGKTIKID